MFRQHLPPPGPPAPPTPPTLAPLPPPPPASPTVQLVPLAQCPLVSTYRSKKVCGIDGVIETTPGQWRLLSRSAEKQRQKQGDTTDKPLMYPTSTVQRAFGESFSSTDEHCTMYGMVGPDGRWTDRCARFTTAVPADWDEFEKAFSGAQLRGGIIGLDFDLPGKADWNDAWRIEMMNLFQTKLQNTLFSQPSVFYTTAHGFRLFYFLSEPVPVVGAGGLHDLLVGLILEAYALGLHVDRNCSDWTRMFRLSRVWRSEGKDDPGHPTWKAGYLRQSWGRVDCSAIEAAPSDGLYRVFHPRAFTPASLLTPDEIARRQWDTSRPECQLLLKYCGTVPRLATGKSSEIIGDGVTASTWMRLLVDDKNFSLPNTLSLKEMLTRATKSTKLFEGDDLAGWALGVLFLGAPMWEGIEQGAEGMHASIGNLARVLCRVLYDRIDVASPVANPQMFHALILRAALVANSKMPQNRRRSEPDLEQESWRLVEHHYRKALGRRDAYLEAQRDEEDFERASALNAFTQQHDELDRLRGHLQNAVTSKCPEAEAWVQQQCRRMYLLETPDGTSVLQRSLNGELAWSCPVKTVSGAVSLIRDSTLAEFTAALPPDQPGKPPGYKTMTQLMDEYGTLAPSMRASRKIKQSGPELQWQRGAMSVKYVEKWGGMRDDIPAVFCPDVDAYLRDLTGVEETYHHLCDWLHLYPNIDERICALYLYGASNIGKTVLGKALRSLTENNMSVPIETLMDDFHESLTMTPFLWTDEFAQVGRDGNRTLLDALKKVVDGSTDPLNRKGRARIQVDSNWRVLITANDNQVIKPGKDITQDTKNALIPRLMFIDVTNAFSRVEKYTQQMKRDKWAEVLIPQHITWLAKEWKVQYPGIRYAKDGMWSKEHDELMTTSKAGKLTMETAAIVLNNPAQASAVFRIHQDSLWVHLSTLSEKVREHIQGRDIDHEQIRQTMLQYATGQRHGRPIRGHDGKAIRMMQLDPRKFLAYFYEHQMDCDFRPFVNNDALWRAWAPPSWVEELDAISGPIHRNAAPPPPPPVSNVIQMPLIGPQRVTKE
jgi:hypothetical protein